MDDHRQDIRYEELYTQLLERGLDMHMHNKKRIRAGLTVLILLPVILGIIRRLTESDKIVFLIIWVFCMFVISIYLISIEYLDDSIQKTLEEVTDTEADFGELFEGTEKLGEKISEQHEKIEEKRTERHERIEARRTQRRDRIHERIQTRHENRQKRLSEIKERIESIQEGHPEGEEGNAPEHAEDARTEITENGGGR